MEENKTSTWEEYRKRTHVIGRVVSAVTLVMLVGAPFLMGKNFRSLSGSWSGGKELFCP